jgi:hypothetical protein
LELEKIGLILRELNVDGIIEEWNN